MSLANVDTATLQSGPELDALIAEKWMGWRQDFSFLQTNSKYWRNGAGLCRSSDQWKPSTNPAHAGEARRKAESWDLHTFNCPKPTTVSCSLLVSGEWQVSGGGSVGWCKYTETNGDKGRAEALATCRAIVDMLKAADEVNDG